MQRLYIYKVRRPRNPLANVASDIFAAGIDQVGQGSQPQFDDLLINWVELAEGRNMNGVPKKRNISFKRTAAGDDSTD